MTTTTDETADALDIPAASAPHRLGLGDAVRATQTLHRTEEWDSRRRVMRKTWKRTAQTVSGVLVGLRTYRQGYTTMGGDYEPNMWTTTDTVAVALVQEDLRKNPVPVPLETLRPAPINLATIGEVYSRRGPQHVAEVLNRLQVVVPDLLDALEAAADAYTVGVSPADVRTLATITKAGR